MKADRFLSLLAIGGSLVVAHVAAFAQGGVPGYPENFMTFDPREVALLPSYCKYTEYFRQSVPGGSNPAEVERWRATIGAPFIHIHHYCFALMKTNRALLLTRTQYYREFYLRDSLNEFNYAIERMPPDFVLLPEILTKRAENLVRLGRGSLGVQDLERAIELNSEYWPPYAQLSDYYKSIGEMDNAKKALESGLEKSPDAPALKRRLAELGPPSRKSKDAGHNGAAVSTE
jgi:tetratricopeptide (TPR) repeat protein